MKKIFGIIFGLLAIYLVGSVVWSILNTQSCSGKISHKDASCEEIAKDNSENCKYVFLKWKKVNYDKELTECSINTKAE